MISLPKGGGAINDLGEKFSADLSSGSGSLSVPVPVPAGRSGATPQLALEYSSGHGNGLFGLGWHLGLPGVSRKTSRGIPLFRDEQDVFLLSGGEDLVPVDGGAAGRQRYRPRTEGPFARIEHVRGGGNDYWEVRGTDGSLTWFGTPRPDGAPADWRDPAVDADPGGRGRVFAWQISESRDPLGNIVRYEYGRDAGQDLAHSWDQPLLTAVAYADYGDRAAPAFLVRVEFDYEPRPDPFSDRRAGFELRTSTRCRTIRVSTHAADGVARMSQELRLSYRPAAFTGASLLVRIEPVGVDDQGPAPVEEALPPLSLTYSEFDPANRRLDRLSGAGLPAVPLDSPGFALVDLHGTGLPDIVELGAAKRFWRNAGSGRFELPRSLPEAPPLSLTDDGVEFMDANGDGRPDLVVSAVTTDVASRGLPAGYFPMTFAGGWSRRSFQTYRQTPAVRFDDPSTRLVDLDGDGLTDVLRSGSRLQAWFNDRDPRVAWQRTSVSNSAAQPPDLADPRVRLADMTGDGLQDIVLITNGNVSYWPNLGHNRWGAKVTMPRSPRLPGDAGGGIGYDPRRVLLGDVDGDGVADLIYVGDGRVLFWVNQSGNAWTDAPFVITGTPRFAGADSAQMVDLHGTGMAGLLFSRSADRADPRFLNFTGGLKPHLLAGFDNHLGAITRVEYGTSTAEYVRDQGDPATRWRTPLPVPVHVVSRVEVTDAISGSRMVTRYRYRHGYWDGEEREFRGFGLVEQLDSETFADPSVPDGHFSPPVLTRNWFHLGPVATVEADTWTELDLSAEYWQDDPPKLAAPAGHAEFLAGLSSGARRDAIRAMRGHLLRTELFALDGTALESRPYSVSESVVGVRQEADRVFLPFTAAGRTTQWERGTDPHTEFTFPAGIDRYGFPLGQMHVAVPRGRDPMTAGPSGAPYLATSSTVEYATRDDADHYLAGRVARTSTFEVVNDGHLTMADLRDATLAGSGQGVSLRLIGHSRTFYDGAAFEGLPLGVLGEHALPVREESLVFTDGFLTGLFAATGARPVYLDPDGVASWPAEYPVEFRTLLPALAGYVHYTGDSVTGSPGGYYTVTNRFRYDVHEPGRVPRGLRTRSMDPLGSVSSMAYDVHDLLPVLSIDAAGLETSAEYDYRVLRPHTVTNANGNGSRAVFSPAGLVTAVFVRGKDGEGDSSEPSTRTEYDLHAFDSHGRPASARTAGRVHHDTDVDVPAADRAEVIVSVEYSDGFGRIVQTRTQAEDVLFGDTAVGGGVLPADQNAPAGGDVAGRVRAPADPENVRVSGWQLYDNKGRVVRAYEPFFATGLEYGRPGDALLGPMATMFYDPRGEVVRTVHPDGSEQRVVHGVPFDLSDPDRYAPTPWESYTYDANDNAGRTHAGTSIAFRDHWNTPASIEVDALGRTVSAVARNRPDTTDSIVIRQSYDITGNLLSVTDALGRVAFRYTYDLAGRRWRADGLDGGRRDTVLDALSEPVESRDSKDALGLLAYDVLHRPIRGWARDAADGRVTLRQRIVYGDAGGPGQPAADRAVARAANLLGRPVRQYDEAGLVVTEAFDFKGNLLRATRRVIADAPLQDTYVRAQANGWVVPGFSVDWQPAPGQTQDQRDAELLEPAGYTTTTTRYDGLSRPTAHLLPVDVEGGRREIRAAYDRSGALVRMSLDGTVYVQHIAYDAKGQRQLIAYGNGVMTRYAYDPRTFRLVRLRTESYSRPQAATYRPAGPVLQDCGYTYDLVGNTLAVRDRTPGGGLPLSPNALDRQFGYDPVYRLVSATGREQATPPNQDPWINLPRGVDVTTTQAYTEQYRYDAGGNLTQLVHSSAGGYTRDFTPAPGTNRVLRMEAGGNPFDCVFDANGNLCLEAGTRRFGWNHADRLMTFATQTEGAEPSVHAHYLYDATGERVKKLVRRQGGGVEVTHYIGGLFEHHRWSGPTAGSTSGANNAVHVLDDQHRVAVVRIGPAHPDDHGPRVAVHLTDDVGSSTATVDGSGALTNREEYSPYGETTFGSYTRKRYRFTGRERDEESSLSYHGSRYYAPWLTRWTSADPAGASGGANQYAYAANNPIHFTDTDGRSPKKKAPGRQSNYGVGTHGPYKELKKTYASKVGRNQVTFLEHPMPGSHVELMMTDPTTGKSDYKQKGGYERAEVMRTEKRGKVPKDRLDNAHLKRLKERVARGEGINYKKDILIRSKRDWDRVMNGVESASTRAQRGATIVGQDGSHFQTLSLREAGKKTAQFEARFERQMERRLARAEVLAKGAKGVAAKAIGIGVKGLAVAGKVTMAWTVAKHSFLAGAHLREGNWRAAGGEVATMAYELLPVDPLLFKPDHMRMPGFGPNQTIFKARIEGSMGGGAGGGCQACHDAVAADNYLKTTVEGTTWELVNGAGIGGNGIPTDAGWKAYENRFRH
ncbi:SpvB/TcaC N-terminal domain-containing protein [Actinoplanes sp. NPDC000266]